MADGVRISRLPEASTPTNNDVLAGVQSGMTKKFSFSSVLAWIKNVLSAADIGAYAKPSGGIPSSDMTSAVQASLGLADTAYQKPSSGIPATDLASGVIPTVPSISTSTPAMDGTGAAGSTGEVSDAGHVHPSDTSKANETELAYVETGTTASRAYYVVGEYFCWNGLLYRVEQPISSGDTFTPGTNCSTATGGGLNQLRANSSERVYKNMNWQLTHSLSLPGELYYMVSTRYLWFGFVQRFSNNNLNIKTVIGTAPTYTNTGINYTFTMPDAADLTVVRV